MRIKIYPDNPDPRAVERAAEILRNGGLIVYPTDTVYAVGCDALNVRAVEKLCALKGIDVRKSKLSIVCKDLSDISAYAKVSNAAFKLLRRNLPGPFTFILPAGGRLPKIYRNKKEVGIRVPDNGAARAIAAGLGNPLLTMSARGEEEEEEYFTNPELIEEKYGRRVEMVADGGEGGREPSTVVRCTDGAFEIVRQGKGILRE